MGFLGGTDSVTGLPTGVYGQGQTGVVGQSWAGNALLGLGHHADVAAVAVINDQGGLGLWVTSNAKFEGRFDRRDFIYIAKDDEYQCPAGQRAIYRFTQEENGSIPTAIGAARARSTGSNSCLVWTRGRSRLIRCHG